VKKMSYSVKTTPTFDRQIRKPEKFDATTILRWLHKQIEGTKNPIYTGTPLVGNYTGKWRYRIGNYRVITKIDGGKLIVLALEVGHRKNIYL